ncbi:MAG: succinylglutamate desuccinylase/aspartoacylase family protein [Burkholderiales bacterium]|nr:succinylglutamate desuccinylase/aspartoacylase family protein [Burkholderiales bacterium]
MSTTTIQAALAAAAPGTRVEGTVPVGNMASGALIGLPFVALRGARPGKTLWINGQVHGNEVTGIVAALEFVNAQDAGRLAGNIVVTSTANPLGFDARRKNAPQDDNDLDMSFPGRANGYTTELFAHHLLREIRAVAPDLVISMHAQGTQTTSRTYTVYKEPPEAPVRGPQLFPYMAAFEPSVACRMSVLPGSGEILGNHSGALDYQLNMAGIPTFMVELGTGQRADPAEVLRGVTGFADVCRRLGIVDGALQTGMRVLRHVTRRGHFPVAHGGLFRPRQKPGEVVRAGEALGEILSIHGHVVERPTAPQDLIIIAIRVDPVVHSGDRVAYVAYEWTEVPV